MLKGRDLFKYGIILALFGGVSAVFAQAVLDDPSLVGAGVGFVAAGSVAMILGKRSGQHPR
jgi:hypothetical protein